MLAQAKLEVGWYKVMKDMLFACFSTLHAHKTSVFTVQLLINLSTNRMFFSVGFINNYLNSYLGDLFTNCNSATPAIKIVIASESLQMKDTSTLYIRFLLMTLPFNLQLF